MLTGQRADGVRTPFGTRLVLETCPAYHSGVCVHTWPKMATLTYRHFADAAYELPLGPRVVPTVDWPAGLLEPIKAGVPLPADGHDQFICFVACRPTDNLWLLKRLLLCVVLLRKEITEVLDWDVTYYTFYPHMLCEGLKRGARPAADGRRQLLGTAEPWLTDVTSLLVEVHADEIEWVTGGLVRNLRALDMNIFKAAWSADGFGGLPVLPSWLQLQLQQRQWARMPIAETQQLLWVPQAGQARRVQYRNQTYHVEQGVLSLVQEWSVRYPPYSRVGLVPIRGHSLYTAAMTKLIHAHLHHKHAYKYKVYDKDMVIGNEEFCRRLARIHNQTYLDYRYTEHPTFVQVEGQQCIIDVIER